MGAHGKYFPPKGIKAPYGWYNLSDRFWKRTALLGIGIHLTLTYFTVRYLLNEEVLNRSFIFIDNTVGQTTNILLFHTTQT
jgi:hypothetical protein